MRRGDDVANKQQEQTNKKLIKKYKFIGFDLSKIKEMNEVVNVARVRQAVCV